MVIDPPCARTALPDIEGDADAEAHEGDERRK
jgi:hypothetical protein